MPHGITADGQQNAHSLTVAGWKRAGALVELFGSLRSDPPTGLHRPDAIYAADGHQAGNRMVQTVAPLAKRLKKELNRSHDKGDLVSLVGDILHNSGTALVCWEHSEIPDIVGKLGKVSPKPPSSWPSDRFDMVWVLTRNGVGWQFQQVPQLLLPDDRSTPLQ
ncbi:MAG: hypothetical protein ACR2G2_10580 [Pseudonocardia sp.]